MSGSGRRGRSLFQRAVEALEAGDLDAARELFLRVLEEDEQHREEAERYLESIRERLMTGLEEGDREEAPRMTRGPRARRRGSRLAFTAPPPPPPGPEDAPVLQVLRRTPHLDVSPEPPAAPGARLTVRVYTDKQALRDGETGEDVVLEGPPEQEDFAVDVWLVAAEPLKVEGPATRRLVIQRSRERSEPAEFTVVRKKTGKAETAVLSAFFAYQGRPCGRVSRAVALAAEAAARLPEEAVASPGIRIEAAAEPPDLSVRVVASETDERLFECVVQTPLLPEYRDGKTGTWRLKSLAADLVREKMARFTAKGASNFVRTVALRSAGMDFFEASPKVFQKAFWDLIDAGTPPRTISIFTEEPYIPWELMVPRRELADGDAEERPDSLGVEFLISRWTSRSHILPFQQVPLRDAYVVAPRDSRLASAEEEAAMVLSQLAGERIDPAGVEALNLSLEQSGRTLLHFICHGKSGAAGSQVLILERKEELEAGFLRAMPGVKKAFRAGRPLIFLNACEVGRQEPALVGAGGFAEVFMALGASGVVAPLWSVKDSIAHEIAVEFYRRIKEEPDTPFAAILRDLRKKSYAEAGGEDTYAAYTFYGDPLAKRAQPPAP